MSTNWTAQCPTCSYMGLTHDADCPDFQYPPRDNPSYHILNIPQGTLGELSKILEEVHEAIDAEKQNNPIMLLVELSDIYGAIVAYLEHHHPSTSMEDLATMAAATKRAFTSGKRKSK